MPQLTRLSPKLMLVISLYGAVAFAEGGYDVRGELFPADHVLARQALEKRFGVEVSTSYRLVAAGCIVPACTDVQRRTAVYTREIAALGGLRREQEVYCSSPAGSARGWTCGQPSSHYFMPTVQGMVRAQVDGDVTEDEALRLATYLQSDCNEVVSGGRISVHKRAGEKDAQGISVGVGMKTFLLKPSQGDTSCPLRIERTGRIVL